MRVGYDPKVDMLSIVLTARAVDVSREVVPGVVLDFDENQQVIAIEIFHASKSTDLSHVDVAVSQLAEKM